MSGHHLVSPNTVQYTRPLLSWLFPLPEWIGRFVVAAAAAEEHERHQPAADQKREESPKPKRDPAMLVHDVLASVPNERGPDHREQQMANRAASRMTCLQ
jgi:hypothetical protein